MRNILPVFGRSPFKALQTHMEKVRETQAVLRPFFEAFLAGDEETVREHRKRILKLEHEADLLKNDLRSHLPKSYFMPVDRRDLLGLLHHQDRLADLCEDLVIVATLRDRLELPPELHAPFMALVDRVIATSDAAYRVIGQLDELLEASFGGPEAESVGRLIDAVSQMEHEVDKAAYKLAQEFFRHETTIGPVSLGLWQKVLELLGGLANASEAVGDQIRLMICS